jgi:transcriptional regulator with XRE-family HTH domain
LASHSLGTRLKAERESRGFTLLEISTSTKIPQALLDGLERDDLSRWPKGLYRRAFFRSYVMALGLRTEPLVTEFARLFPDEPSATAGPDDIAAGNPDAPNTHPPLALSWAGPTNGHRMLRSAAIAVAEVAAIAAVGGVIAWTSGVQLLAAIGGVALVYLPGARVAAGRGRRWQVPRRRTSAAVRVETGDAVLVPAADAPAPTRSFADVRTAVVERSRPVGVGIATAAAAAAPVARRTGHLLKVGTLTTGRLTARGLTVTSGHVFRTSTAAARRLATATHATSRASARGFAALSLAFWKAVRSVAEQAEVMASRQLKRD